jgi:hypothetical protein
MAVPYARVLFDLRSSLQEEQAAKGRYASASSNAHDREETAY